MEMPVTVTSHQMMTDDDGHDGVRVYLGTLGPQVLIEGDEPTEGGADLTIVGPLAQTIRNFPIGKQFKLRLVRVQGS